MKKSVKKIKDCEIQTVDNRFDIASLDTGIRTFQTLYGLDHCVEIGKGDSKTILQLLRLGDYYQSMITSGVSKRKYKIKKKHINKRIKGLVNDLHRKTVSFLVNNYKNVLLPDFRVSQMVKGKKLHKSVKRQMFSLEFFKFKQRLIDKGKKRNCCIGIVDESYTTKTCGVCGKRYEVGTSKIFNCPNRKCLFYGIEIDRDINGARNVLIKNLFSVLGGGYRSIPEKELRKSLTGDFCKFKELVILFSYTILSIQFLFSLYSSF